MDTYASLFAVIGEKYGKGDGLSTFQVPDFRGMFLRGHDGADGFSGGWGKKQMDELKSHTNSVNGYGAYNRDVHTAESGRYSGIDDINLSPISINPTGGNETRPMNYCVFYCIKHGEMD